MTAPLIATIIPVYNGERFLDEAIASVLAQDYLPVEVIIVDDGSTDETAAIARSYTGVRYLCQENAGVAAARNTGILATKAPLIAFLDHDDRWAASKLRRQVEVLANNPDTDIVFTRHRIFIQEGCEAPSWLRPDLLQEDSPGYFLSTMLARRRVFDAVGLFDPSLRVAEDLEWMTRARHLATATEVLPDILMEHRVHDSNLSSQVATNHAAMARVLRAAVTRKRRAAGKADGHDPHTTEA